MNILAKNTINLIADIGGTNIRIALADQSCKANYKEIETYQCANFESLADVLALYIDNKQLSGSTINACLAIACLVD